MADALKEYEVSITHLFQAEDEEHAMEQFVDLVLSSVDIEQKHNVLVGEDVKEAVHGAINVVEEQDFPTHITEGN